MFKWFSPSDCKDRLPIYWFNFRISKKTLCVNQILEWFVSCFKIKYFTLLLLLLLHNLRLIVTLNDSKVAQKFNDGIQNHTSTKRYGCK